MKMKSKKTINVEVNYFRPEKGITLIALVITIIVLLILAGITITLVMGQNGLIAKAQESGKNMTEAKENEDTELAKLDNSMGEYITGTRGYELVDIFNSITYVTETGSMTASGATPAQKQIELEPGKYLIVGAARTNEYSPVLKITGSDNIKKIGDKILDFSNFNSNNYNTGSGGGSVSLYTVDLSETTTLTLCVQSGNSSYYGTGNFGIYKFDI